MAHEDYKELFKPEIINSVSGLSLISRVIVDGFLSGLNKSRRVGAGLEFSQYRGYEPGDDLRLLDWKMLARSGRYYMKQSEIDTHVTVKFIVDASTSMLHEEGRLSKNEYAKVLIAVLANLSLSQGDAVGLLSLNNQALEHIQPSVSKQHFNRLLYRLIHLKNEGKWPKEVASHKLHNHGHRELLIFITDLYENEAEITKLIKNLKTSRNEIVVLHIVGNNELEFNYQGQVIFEDLETGSKIKVNTREARDSYLNAFNLTIDRLRDDLLSNDIGYELFNLDTDIDQALQLFLKKRNKLL